MKIYICTILLHANDIPTCTCTWVATPADSEEEAKRKFLIYANEVFPASKGFTAPSIVVNEMQSWFVDLVHELYPR